MAHRKPCITAVKTVQRWTSKPRCGALPLLQDALLDREGDRSSAAVSAGLLVDVGDVTFHRVQRDVQLNRDFFAAEPLGELGKDFHLAVAEAESVAVRVDR